MVRLCLGIRYVFCQYDETHGHNSLITRAIALWLLSTSPTLLSRSGALDEV